MAPHRVLLRSHHRLDDRRWARLDAAFTADDELDLECVLAGKEAFCDLYARIGPRPRPRSETGMPSFRATTSPNSTPSPAPTIRQWEQQFLNYFDSRVTNARSEARNLIVKQAKRSGVRLTGASTITASAFSTAAHKRLNVQSPR